MSDKILFVDDDANILAAFQRQLRRHFTFDTSTDATAVIESIDTSGPYAVIVSDMRMPGMNGVQFLGKIRERYQDTVRIMLTGNADQQTAVDAVNEGEIFRFLTKPCSTETLATVLTAAIKQYHLVTAEKELLEKTLRGSVRVLTDILGLIHPIAFSRSPRIQLLVRQVATKLELENLWQLDIAAMLSQIGCVTLLPDTLDAIYAGQDPSPSELDRYRNHPKIALQLLSSIPRLEAIAKIVGHQQDPFDASLHSPKPKDRDPIAAGAQVLHVAIRFDRLIGQGVSPRDAIAELLKRPDQCDPAIVRCLDQVALPEGETEIRVIPVRELKVQMTLDEDVRAKNGSLIVTSGQAVTYALIERLRNFRANGAIPDMLRVRVSRLSPQTPCLHPLVEAATIPVA